MGMEATAADTAMASTTPQPPQYISPTKHNRIDIWRTEVAAAHHALTASTSTNSTSTSPSIASSSSGTSSSSASHTNNYFNGSGGGGPGHPRRPSIWRRLARRLSGRSFDDFTKPEDVWDQDMRTNMYKEEAKSRSPTKAPGDDEDVPLGEELSDNGGGGLLATKERLERAARLLERSA